MEAVREIGPMVEVSQVGAEELEWHRRFHEAGWRVVFFPGSSVIHIGSQTVRAGMRSIYAEYLKGSLYYFRIHHGRASYYALCACLFSMFGIKTAYAFLTRNREYLRETQRYNRVIRDAFRADFKPLNPWGQTGP
jgi:GT2 family glycosyltransferase